MLMWIKKLLLILCLCSVCQAAQIIRYVDPDVVAGDSSGDSWTNAYASLSAWEAAEQTNLDAANNYMTVYCRSSAGTHDDTLCAINGWTTSATDYIEIIGTDFPADGIFDDTKYIKHDNNIGYGIYIFENYVRISNLQFLVTAIDVDVDKAKGIYIASVGTTDIRIDSCIIKGVCSGTEGAYGIYIYDATATVKISNTLVYGFRSTDFPADSSFWAISMSGTTQLYNCTTYNNFWGYYGAATITNCIVGGSAASVFDFSGAQTIVNCCSDEGLGSNPQAPAGGAWANEFNSIAGEDFSLKAGSNCIGTGVDDPGSGLYSDDIIGTARTSTWDIGAFEYTGAAPAGGQLIMIQEF